MKYTFTFLLLNFYTVVFSQDRIIKNDNSIIEGKVISFDGKKIILFMNDKTEVRIPKEIVSEIKFGKDVENSSVLTGIGRGPGTVSGFGGRDVKRAPQLQESPQKEGRVALSVCVDANGNVTSADFKAAGSTTTDNDLIDAAKRDAWQYRFAPSSADKQCGTITYNFIVH